MTDIDALIEELFPPVTANDIRIEIAPDGNLILSPIPGVPSTIHADDADDIIARLR